MRDFDVATHRPHPPGYPVYIALGKARHRHHRLWHRRAAIGGRSEGTWRCCRCWPGSSRLCCCTACSRAARRALARASTFTRVRRGRDDGDVPVVLVSRGAADERSAWPRLRPRVAGVPDARVVAAAARRRRRSPLVPGSDARLGPDDRRRRVSRRPRDWRAIADDVAHAAAADRRAVRSHRPRCGRRVDRRRASMFAAGGLAWGIPLLVASGGLERLPGGARHPGRRRFHRRRDALHESEPAGGGLRADPHVRPSLGCHRARDRRARARRRRHRPAAVARSAQSRAGHRDERAVSGLSSAVSGHVVRPLRAAARAGRGVSGCARHRPRLRRGGADCGRGRCRLPAVAIASPVLVAYAAEPESHRRACWAR